MSEAIYSAKGGVRAHIWVVPASSSDEIVGMHGDRLKIKTASPAEGGRANESVRRLLQELFGCPVSLAGGRTSRAKIFLIEGIDVETALRNLDR